MVLMAGSLRSSAASRAFLMSRQREHRLWFDGRAKNVHPAPLQGTYFSSFAGALYFFAEEKQSKEQKRHMRGVVAPVSTLHETYQPTP